MIIRTWADHPSVRDLAYRALKDEGDVVSMRYEEDFRPGDIAVLYSFSGRDFSSIADDHPDTRFLIVGAKSLFSRPNVRHVRNLVEAQKVLRQLLPKKETPPLSHGIPDRVPKRKRTVRTSPCPNCGKAITISLRPRHLHETACRKLPKPASRATLYCMVQPCGKVRGSILVADIPGPIEILRTRFEKGLHVVRQPRFVSAVVRALQTETNLAMETLRTTRQPGMSKKKLLEGKP